MYNTGASQTHTAANEYRSTIKMDRQALPGSERRWYNLRRSATEKTGVEGRPPVYLMKAEY